MAGVAAAVAVAVVTAGACGLGDKEAQADRVVAAARTTATAGVVGGVVTLAITPIPPKYPSLVAAAIVAGGQSQATARFRIEDGRAAALGPLAGEAFPFVRFDDRGIAMRRPDAPANDARPWLEVVFDDLEEESGRIETLEPGTAAGMLAVLDPRVLLDLAAGPLAGSIEPTETAAPADGMVSLAANFDLEKALTDTRESAYDDDRTEQTRLILELLRVKPEPGPGRVAIGSDGTVRAFRVALVGELNRETRYTIDIAIDVDEAEAQAGDLTVGTRPSPGATIRTESLIPLVRAAVAAAATADAVTIEIPTAPTAPTAPAPDESNTDG